MRVAARANSITVLQSKVPNADSDADSDFAGVLELVALQT